MRAAIDLNPGSPPRLAWIAPSLLCLGLTVGFGCGGADDDSPMPSSSGPSTGVPSTTGGESDDSGTTIDPIPDVDPSTGEDGTAEAGGEPGCKKVDFLFVIDNSGSMLEEQQALISSFDDFISAIDQNIDAQQDFHIMVTDVDDWVFDGCPALCNFPLLSCEALSPPYSCGTMCETDADCVGMGNETCNAQMRCAGTQTTPMQCENILGAGVTYPRGENASNTDCNFSTGKRYMDSSEGIALVGKFSCAASVGTGSTDDPERPMEAMVAAVEEGSSAVATCNEGFLRDDAILVVTFITDEDDDDGDGSSGSAQQWYDRVVAAKNGDPKAVVMLGVYGNAGCAEPSSRLDAFMNLWGDQGRYGEVCASNYGPFFQEAVQLIDTTCDDFIPPEG